MRRFALFALFLGFVTVPTIHAATLYQLTLSGPSTDAVFTEPSSWSFYAGPVLIEAAPPSGSGTYNGISGYTFLPEFFLGPLSGGHSFVLSGYGPSSGPAVPYLQLDGLPIVSWEDQISAPFPSDAFIDTVSITIGTFPLETAPYLSPNPARYVLTIEPVPTATPEPLPLLLISTALLAAPLFRIWDRAVHIS